MTAGSFRQIYVAASVGPAHVVVSFDQHGAPRGFAAGIGALAEAPFHASPRGITLVVIGANGPEAIGYEWSRLQRDAHACDRLF